MRLIRSGGKTDNSPDPRLDKGLALTVLTGLGLMLVIGVVFSVAYGAQRITTAAVQQQQVSESLRSATVLRAQVAIAVLLGTVEDELTRVNAGDWRAEAIAQSEKAIADLEEGVEELASADRFADAPFVDDTGALIDTVTVVLDHLEAEEFEEAREVSNSRLDALYQRVGGEFLAHQQTLSEEINSADSLLGWIEVVARFLVAFFIPAAVIIVYREMVIRRQKERELEHRLDAERALARAREEFVANASHELRTPLTGIAGMAMLLEEDLANSGTEMSRELVDTIIRESSDLERIVEDLLTTARLDAGALHFAFEDVIVALEVEEATASLIRNGFEIDVHCEAGIVRADPSRLRQVIRNLLSNAKKYGGPNIRISGTSGEGTYVLEVADDGDGVPARVREHLFERFVHREGDDARTDSVGLGLSIVHALVVGMGGAISYDHVGGESVFSIRLPLAGERPMPPPAPRTAPQETAVAPGGGDG